MTKEEYVEKEVAVHPVDLDAHNRSTLRSMKPKEWDFWEGQAVQVDNHTGRDDQ